MMERIALAIHATQREPLLLVGETGRGKTTVIQHLSALLRVKLTVINMSQQSDSSDLLGGYKPVDIKIHLILPLRDQFDALFKQSFSVREN